MKLLDKLFGVLFNIITLCVFIILVCKVGKFQNFFQNFKKMKDKNLFFRGLIFHYYKTGMSASKIFKTLKSIYEDECPSLSFISKWRGRFVCGQTSFEDEPRSGAPMRHEEGKYNEIIMKLIEQDRYISIKDIACALGFSNTKTRLYINKNLGLKKRMCKWVPHFLTNEQKKSKNEFLQIFY